MTYLLSKEQLDIPLSGRPGPFDFSNVERNLALCEMAKEKGGALPKAMSTGTTIVASLYKDGVMIGADSRSTMGHIIANKNAMKLHRITDTIYAGGAGTAADLGKVTQMIGAEMKLYELNNEGKKARVIMAHRRLRHYLYQYQGHIGAYLLIGGVDATGPNLYEVSASGSGYSKPFGADGSGSFCAIAEMEARFKKDMTEQECREMIIKAVEAGMHGDNMSGNSYNLITITADGKRQEGPFVPSFAKRPQNIEGDYVFAEGTTEVYKGKSKTLEVLETQMMSKNDKPSDVDDNMEV